MRSLDNAVFAEVPKENRSCSSGAVPPQFAAKDRLPEVVPVQVVATGVRMVRYSVVPLTESEAMWVSGSELSTKVPATRPAALVRIG